MYRWSLWLLCFHPPWHSVSCLFWLQSIAFFGETASGHSACFTISSNQRLRLMVSSYVFFHGREKRSIHWSFFGHSEILKFFKKNRNCFKHKAWIFAESAWIFSWNFFLFVFFLKQSIQGLAWRVHPKISCFLTFKWVKVETGQWDQVAKVNLAMDSSHLPGKVAKAPPGEEKSKPSLKLT